MKPPKLLEPGSIKEINDYLLEKAECFAFLTNGNQWHFQEPKSGQEAFQIWSIGLYTVYHDYGTIFLLNILDTQNAASRNLDSELIKCKKHVDTIQKVFRANICHGLINENQRNQIKEILGKQYIRNAFKTDWKTYFDDLSEDEWWKAAKKIKKDSDLLFDTLKKWADEFHSSKIPYEVLNPRERFCNSEVFKRGISFSTIFEDIDRDFNSEEKTAQEILGAFAKSQAKQWCEQIAKDYADKKLNGPDDIITSIKCKLTALHNRNKKSSIEVAAGADFGLNDLLSR